MKAKTLLIRESVLFAAHRGTIGSKSGTICGPDSCLPIAFSRNCDEPGGEHGLHNLWEEHGVPHEFFGDDPYSGIGVPHFECYRGASNSDAPGGLYVYDCEWVLSSDGWPDVEEDDDPTLHLRGGKIRRPTPDEVSALIVGQCPWQGGVLL